MHIKYPEEEFDKFVTLLKENTHYAFSRYSDGELTILQNKYLELGENFFIQGNKSGAGMYTEEEIKLYNPAVPEHLEFRDKLVDSLRYRNTGYFKGICTRSDVSNDDFNFQLELALGPNWKEDHFSDFTFANVFINANYTRYIKELVPLFNSKKIIFILNKAAKITTDLPFEVDKDFRVGSNCMMENQDIPTKVVDYLIDNKVEDAIILCSAASLSNIIAHKVWEATKENWVLDIGSSLNPLLGLDGWKYSRGYLQQYWLGMVNRYGNQIDKW